MNVAIIGSRERNLPEDRLAVYRLVDSLNDDDVVVSGGCKGIDSWAIQASKEREPKLKTVEFEPIMLFQYPSYPELVKAYYARNRKVVENSDVVYAFPSAKGLKGGTKNTVEYAKKCGKKVIFK